MGSFDVPARPRRLICAAEVVTRRRQLWDHLRALSRRQLLRRTAGMAGRVGG
jgi:hypothetical protein